MMCDSISAEVLVVVISHMFISYPGDFVPILVAHGNVETASKGLRKELGNKLVQVSEGLFTIDGSMIKVDHVPFVGLSTPHNTGQVVDIVNELKARLPK